MIIASSFILLIGLLLGLRRIKTALLLALVLIPTYVLRLEFFGVPSNLFEIFLGGVFLSFLWVYRKSLKLIVTSWLSALWLPLVLIAIGLILGTLVSPDIPSSLGIVKSWFIVPVLLSIMLVTSFEKFEIPMILYALLVSAIPLLLVAPYQLLSGQFITIDHRVSAWFTSANYLAMYLVPIIFLSLPVLLTPGNPNWWPRYPFFIIPRNIVIGFLALAILTVFFTFSYGGWFGLLAGLLFLGLTLGRKSLAIFTGAVIGFLGIALATQIPTARFQAMLDPTHPSSLRARLQTWATDWLMVKTHPLTGIGLGTYEQQYLDYARKLFNPPQETYMLHAHNLYLQFIIYLGVLGLTGFLALLVKVWQYLRTNWNLTAISIGAALTAMLAHGLVDTTYFKNDLAVLFWVLVALSVTNSSYAEKI